MPELSKDELSRFLPHAGAMRLIDCVESWDAAAIRCRSMSHHDTDNPLRQGTRLEAVAGLEYAAQAMGVHVGVLRGDRSTDGLIGYVGGVRDVVVSVDRLDEAPGALTIEAVRLVDDEHGFMYRFSISAGGRDIMSGRASIFLKQA